MTERDTITVAEAADALGVRTDAIRARIRRGTLEAVKRGRFWYVYADAIAAEERQSAARQAGAEQAAEAEAAELQAELQAARERIAALSAEIEAQRATIKMAERLAEQAQASADHERKRNDRIEQRQDAIAAGLLDLQERLQRALPAPREDAAPGSSQDATEAGRTAAAAEADAGHAEAGSGRQDTLETATERVRLAEAERRLAELERERGGLLGWLRRGRGR